YTYPFQDQPAVADLSFSVAQGEAVLCTGASGSGKSTLIRLINGLAPHFHKGRLKGRVSVAGKDTALTPVRELSARVGTMFQDPESQFFALRVRDELGFALECRGTSLSGIRSITERESARFGLEGLMDAMIFDLSQGEKQKLALAGILCMDPGIIILDEPSANLDPGATRELAVHLLALKRRGITLFIVDHRLYWLRELVDSVLVLDRGRLACRGDFGLLEDEGVRHRFGLRSAAVRESALPPAEDTSHINTRGDADHRISAEGLTFGYKKKPPLFEDVSFDLPRGRVIAVTGCNGAGKTTLARILTGLLPVKKGRIRINGRALSPKSLLARASIVLQNTDHQLHMKTVRRELEISARGNTNRDRAVADALVTFGLDRFEYRHPQSLSGGQKQRLVIAAALVKSPDIFILDEPTSGLDGTNMKIIARVMTGMARSGACVLVITHDLELMDRACACALSLPLS
ncbi:MAG: ABC transporter ATP-binding protein, partial [Desulfobacterales bacterium]|nr:ABC transporter ATP-binding protein [Desulfobacterales bacterium]